MSRWTLLLPANWRETFGPEIDELLDESDHPLRDRLDIARLALTLHASARWRNMRQLVLTLIALMGVALSGVLSARAAGQLTHGWVEIPGHWWSSLALTPLLLSAVCFFMLWRRPPRSPLR